MMFSLLSPSHGLLAFQTSSPRTENFQHCNKCQSETQG
jgi:hypothetical protein